MIYYAHHMWKYNTNEEIKEINLIKKRFKNEEIINPNGAIIETGDNKEAMEQCFKLVNKCNILVFTTFSGVPGRGIYDEVNLALQKNKKVYLLKNEVFTQIYNLNDIVKIIFEKTKTNKMFAKLK